MTAGRIFNLQRFALQDGPGLRTTVFLKGCPLACAWCHNPESRSERAQVVRIASRCMACGLCPEEELRAGRADSRRPEDVQACPTGALQALGRLVEAEALAAELLRDRIFFDESGGGVTFSGGEPLQQAAFVAEAMARLHAEGVHTALDTCGYGSWAELETTAGEADLVLYDLKLMDEDRHLAATGVTNGPILENLRALARVHDAIRVRVPIIPGVNDDEENLTATADFLATLSRIQQVDLLPYHGTGEAKFARLGMTSPLQGTPPPDRTRMEACAAPFLRRALPTTFGG